MKRSTTRLIKRALQLNDKDMLAFIQTLCNELVRRSGDLEMIDILKMVLTIDELQKGDK